MSKSGSFKYVKCSSVMRKSHSSAHASDLQIRFIKGRVGGDLIWKKLSRSFVCYDSTKPTYFCRNNMCPHRSQQNCSLMESKFIEALRSCFINQMFGFYNDKCTWSTTIAFLLSFYSSKMTPISCNVLFMLLIFIAIEIKHWMY